MELTDLESVERLTGLAFFTPSGAGSSLHLGNVEMIRLDYGLKSVEILRARRGQVYPRRRHFYGRTPVFALQLNQFTSATQSLFISGSVQAPVTQDATEGATYSFTAVLGGAWSLGKSEIFLTSVMVDDATMELDADFGFDDHNGWIWIPAAGSRIAAGDIVDVTFDYPALSLENYAAFDTPSRDGILTVYCEDEYGPPARERWIMNVTLSCKSLPDTDPAKFRSASIEAMIYGNPQVIKRPFPSVFGEILTDTDAVIDMS